MERGSDWNALIEGSTFNYSGSLHMEGGEYEDRDSFFQRVANQAEQFQVNKQTPKVIRVTFMKVD